MRFDMYGAVALGAVVMLAVATARAGDAEDAQKAFDEGMKLMGKKDYAKACPKLAESLALDSGVATRFRLAQCYEAQGRYASAWKHYDRVRELSHAAGQGEREKVAEERAAAVAPKVSKLKLTIPRAVVEAEPVVMVDGETIPAASWAAPIPADEGEHEIRVVVPGHDVWTTTSSVEGAGTTTVVVIEDVTGSKAPPASAASSHSPPIEATMTGPADEPAGPADEMPDEDVGRDDGGPGVMTFTGVGVGIAGLALLGAGIGVGVTAKSKYDGAEGCDGNVCEPEGVATREDARRQGNVATALFVVGAAAAAGGALLWVFDPADDEAPEVALLPTGMMARWRW